MLIEISFTAPKLENGETRRVELNLALIEPKVYLALILLAWVLNLPTVYHFLAERVKLYFTKRELLNGIEELQTLLEKMK